MTACEDGAVRLWDAGTGRLLGEPLLRGKTWPSAAFSPDGRWIVTVAEGEARLWDARTRRPVQAQPSTGGQVWAATAAFSPDGRRLFIGGAQGEIAAWDIEAGTFFWPLKTQPAAVEDLQVSSDGTMVLARSARIVNLFDADTGGDLAMPLWHDASVTRFTFDGRRVVTMSQDTVRIWDARVRSGIGLPMRLEPRGIHTILSTDGRLAVTLLAEGKDRSLQPWTVATGEALGPVIPLGSHALSSYLLPSLSPDGRRVLVVFEDHSARLWDVGTGQPVGGLLQHEKPIIVALFSPDGQLAATGSRDGIVQLWDAGTGRPAGLPLRHEAPLFSAAMAPGSRLLATGDQAGTVRIWDARTSRPLRALPSLKYAVGLLRFGLDDRQLLTTLLDGRMQLWDVQTGKPASQTMDHESYVNDAAFHSGGLLATGSKDNTVRLWNLPDGTPAAAPLRYEAEIRHVRLSPDGERLVTTTQNNQVTLWSTRTGERLGSPRPGLDASFTPDGQQLIVALRETAQIWDLMTGAQEGPEVLATLAEAVAGLELSREGKVEPVDPASRLNDLRTRAGESDSFVRWFLQDPWERTISPSSAMTVEQYIHKLLDEGPPDVKTLLRQLFPGHPLLASSPKPD